VLALPQAEQRSWLRGLAPDDAADLVQEASTDVRDRLISMLDDQTRKEVQALLAYREDHAGGLMNPRFARLRPEMTVDEAVTYLRRQTRQSVEMTYYAYVLDASQHLLGVVSFRELMAARGDRRVSEVMKTDVRAVDENVDQEAVARLFRETSLMAIPVVDRERRMKGIVTVDDIVEVVSQEATEDIQKLGGSESLGEPYLQIAIGRMIKKRGRLAGGAVPRRDAHRHRDGLLREGDRPGGGAGAVRAADHLLGRQLRVASHLAGDPRHGAGRAAAARLVPGDPARAGRGARAGVDPGLHRHDAHPALAGVLQYLRAALSIGRPDGCRCR